MSDRTWPKDLEPRTKEEWMEVATSKDPSEVQLISTALKALKFSARDYVTWSKEDRIDAIMKHQPDGGAAPAKRASKKKVSKRAGKRKGASRPQTSEAAATTSSGGGGDGGGAAVALLEKLQESVDLMNETLTQRMDELEAKIDTIDGFVTETHYGFACIAMGDADIRGNFEDENVQEELLGTLQILGEEGDEEEGED